MRGRRTGCRTGNGLHVCDALPAFREYLGEDGVIGGPREPFRGTTTS